MAPVWTRVRTMGSPFYGTCAYSGWKALKANARRELKVPRVARQWPKCSLRDPTEGGWRCAVHLRGGREEINDLILRSRAQHGVSKDGCTAVTRCHPSRRASSGAPQDEAEIISHPSRRAVRGIGYRCTRAAWKCIASIEVPLQSPPQ